MYFKVSTQKTRSILKQVCLYLKIITYNLISITYFLIKSMINNIDEYVYSLL